jgi:hypothetical protein
LVMSFRCTPLWVVLCLLLGGVAACAQTVSASIPAWVEGNNCGKSPEFEATFDGKQVPVTSQLGPGSNQIILVVFDVTGDLSLIDPAKQAVIAQISKLPANTWVGLLRDEDGLHVLADPSPNRKPLIEAIQSLANSGAPGLLETVRSSLILADGIIRSSPVRVSVLYITDGSIYRYREDYTNPVINESDPHDLSRRFPGALIQEKISKLGRQIDSLEAPLFVVHLSYRHDRLNTIYQDGLETLAGFTGGRAGICRSVAEIPETISAMFGRMSSAWRVTLAIPSKMHENAQVRLSAPCRDEAAHLSWRTRFHPKGG